MQVTETKNEGLTRDYKVVVAAADITARVTDRLTELGQKARIPGFRPGKIPMTVLSKRFKGSVMEGVVEGTVRDTMAEMLGELELLLEHAEVSGFLSEGGPRNASDALLLLWTINLEGERVGAWKIEEPIAKGGMGSVYRAARADGAYQKTAALKVVRQRMATDSAALRRFRAERQILADIKHPNIARLLDGGTTKDEIPYFVMDYVDGKRIDRYCDDNGLTIEERLDLFRTV